MGFLSGVFNPKQKFRCRLQLENSGSGKFPPYFLNRVFHVDAYRVVVDGYVSLLKLYNK